MCKCVFISTNVRVVCIKTIRLEFALNFYLTIRQRGRVVYEQIVNEGELFMSR